MIEAILQSGIEERAFTCAACSLRWPGKDRQVWHVGQADPERGVECGAETVFDLASLTKPICTSTTLLALCERGKLSLRDPVGDWLPEARHLKGVTVFHLATHTSGLPAWRPFYQSDELLHEALQTPLERLPSMGHVYSDVGYILLGVILERAGGDSLRNLANELVFRPLGLGFQGGSYAVTGNCPWREGKTLRGEPHDANAAALGGFAGHAGLFGTLDDVASYSESLLPGAIAPPLRSRGAMDALLRNQIGELEPRSIGFFTHGSEMLPDPGVFGRSVVGHTGFTGTVMLVNYECGPAMALLTNRVFSDPDGGRFQTIRRRLFSALAGV